MVAGNPNGPKLPFVKSLAASSIAACFAEICTLPLDTAKVRLQVQGGSSAGGALKYRGLIGTVVTIAREEGAMSLYKGIVPGLQRQCVYGGIRLSLYDPVKTLYSGNNPGEASILTKIAAGMTTGALGIMIANPTDVVKVRMQAEGKLGPGAVRRYSSSFDAYSKIARQEGVATLWRGMGPNIARNAIINAAELASYDQIKVTLLGAGMKDDINTHMVAGLGAGFFAVILGSPVDVVKSRVMSDSQYKGTIDCFIKTFRNDGILAFYKGFIPNFARLGSWNVICFITLEQVKMLFAGKNH